MSIGVAARVELAFAPRRVTVQQDSFSKIQQSERAELVATDAPEQVRWPPQLIKQLCNSYEGIITGQVSIPVIVRLHLIDVDEEKRQRAASA